MPGAIATVVVDHDTGPLLQRCVASLLDDGAQSVIVVENGTPRSVEDALDGAIPSQVSVVRPGRNLGFGAGVNRGLAALAGSEDPPELVLISNTDLHVHPGALAELASVLVASPAGLGHGGAAYP